MPYEGIQTKLNYIDHRYLSNACKGDGSIGSHIGFSFFLFLLSATTRVWALQVLSHEIMSVAPAHQQSGLSGEFLVRGLNAEALKVSRRTPSEGEVAW